MPTLNLGILAHVDAGKTSLTERLLFDAGVIDRLGSVDTGDTQTDTGAIERRRGITVRAAVASFPVGDLRVNLVDTPGHPDFIAEVERALAVLDAAVLVVSAVEGVQAQTRVLLRTLRRLGLPTLVFVNKIDRRGARERELLAELRRKLSVPVVALNTVADLGSASARGTPYHLDHPHHRDLVAEAVADVDEAILTDLVAGAAPAPDRLRHLLAAHTATGQLHPVVFGSALTGAGVDTLREALRMLPTPAPTPDSGELDGLVFAVDHDAAGRRSAYLRLYSGQLRPRQRVPLHRPRPDGSLSHLSGKATAVAVVGTGGHTLAAGDIARVAGLDARVGDRVGSGRHATAPCDLPRPSLETVVRPRPPADPTVLRTALQRLAERDPLIDVRPRTGGAASVLLYGEVQREVIAATLREEFGLEAVFEPSQIVHLERPAGTGEGLERISRTGFAATVGLRVEPAPAGSGVAYQVAAERGLLPPAFHRTIEETVRRTLQEGLYGWPVSDCTVTLTECDYAAPVSTAGDFRGATPLVLLAALARAGTRVFEPCHRFELEVPADTAGAVLTRLAACEAVVADTRPHPVAWLLVGDIPARRMPELQRGLPGLTRGEGAWSSRPHGDRPVLGRPPHRERTDGNPLDRGEYLEHLRRLGRR